MKKILILVLLLIFQSAPAVAGENSVKIVSGDFWNISSGSVLVYNNPGPPSPQIMRCTKIGDEICKPENLKDMQARFVFPLCSNSATVWCIQELRITKEGQKPVSAQFERYIEGGKFESDPRYGLPEGKTISLWKSKNFDTGKEEYFAVHLTSWMRWFNGTPFFGQAGGSVTRVELLKGAEYQTVQLIPGNGDLVQHQGVLCEGAVFVSKGECGAKSLNQNDVRIGVSFVIPNETVGFLAGRLGNPLISSTENSPSTKIISLDANQITVPRLDMKLSDTQIMELVPGLTNATNYVMGDNRQDGDSLKKFEVLRKFSGDKSSKSESIWNFTILSSVISSKTGSTMIGTLDSSGKLSIDYASKCVIPKSALLGLVSTNAMILDPNPPSFSDGEFIYNVAGMHFEPDGTTLTRGTYNLIISKALAGCLYEKNSIPTRATVRILNDSVSGSNLISTEIVKQVGDYFSINISNFNFSNPAIRIKLEYGSEQLAPAGNSASEPIPSAISDVKKKTTITCVKGKLTKKVTSISPKCPAGYKKKAQ